MSVRLQDPGRVAHLERVLARRKKEGRSGAPDSIGRVVPTTFPPPQEAPVGGVGGGDDARAAYHREREELEQERADLARLKEDTRREIEAQRQLAAQTESQLKWQQQQQLVPPGQLPPPAGSVEERLRLREAHTRQASPSLTHHAAPEAGMDDVARRLQSREASLAAPPRAGDVPAYPQPLAPPPPAAAARDPKDYDRLQSRVDELERKLTTAMTATPQRGASVDPYEVSVRREGPAAFAYPTPATAATPASMPPPPPAEPAGAYSTASAYQPPPAQPYSAAAAYQPPAPAQAAPRMGDVSHLWLGRSGQAQEDAVFEMPSAQPPINATQPRQDAGYGSAAGFPSSFPMGRVDSDGVFGQHPNGAAAGVEFGAVRQSASPMGPAAALARLPANEVAQRTVQANQGHIPRDGLAALSPRSNPYRSQGQGGYQQILRNPGNAQQHKDVILHDMKCGDWFIKWTKNDKPHLRWFWLNYKKLLLVWSNTQNASVFMSKSLRLEEVVSIRAEQLTEESPGDPGHPQIYYLMNIVTYERQLQIACQNKEKFNKWFEGLSMLTQQYRQINEVAFCQAYNPAMASILSNPATQAGLAQGAYISAAD